MVTSQYLLFLFQLLCVGIFFIELSFLVVFFNLFLCFCILTVPVFFCSFPSLFWWDDMLQRRVLF